ncbi:hypothetical protein BC943DRAFT_131634 [Umbelopsis sp. AD052]|nr:hypothetical protein BC943DRAFT_131634 [Umbelopsis sp. AD052]
MILFYYDLSHCLFNLLAARLTILLFHYQLSFYLFISLLLVIPSIFLNTIDLIIRSFCFCMFQYHFVRVRFILL